MRCKAAEEVRAKMHADMLRDPGMGGMVQHMHLTPLFAKLRFGDVGRGAGRAGAARRTCRTCVRSGTPPAAWRTPPAGRLAEAEQERAGGRDARRTIRR